MSRLYFAAYQVIGSPVRNTISAADRAAQSVLVKPYSTAMVAPIASMARNETAPKAVLAMRNTDQRRKPRAA